MPFRIKAQTSHLSHCHIDMLNLPKIVITPPPETASRTQYHRSKQAVSVPTNALTQDRTSFSVNREETRTLSAVLEELRQDRSLTCVREKAGRWQGEHDYIPPHREFKMKGEVYSVMGPLNGEFIIQTGRDFRNSAEVPDEKYIRLRVQEPGQHVKGGKMLIDGACFINGAREYGSVYADPRKLPKSLLNDIEEIKHWVINVIGVAAEEPQKLRQLFPQDNTKSAQEIKDEEKLIERLLSSARVREFVPPRFKDAAVRSLSDIA